jgi:hypothetical protein
VTQPLIRIGRSSNFEVVLPAKEFPNVGVELVELEVSNGMIRLVTAGDGRDEAYLNNRPAVTGSLVLSGDVLRLGVSGPEFRVAFSEKDTQPVSTRHEPTRAMSIGELSGREPTQAMSVSGLASDSTTGPTVAWNSLPESQHRPSGRTEPVIAVAQRKPSTPAPHAVAVDDSPEDWPDRGRVEKKVSEPVMPASSDTGFQGLQSKLKTMQILQVVSLLFLVGLLGWNFQLSRQLSRNSDEIKAMHAQANDAVGQFTPALDNKLGNFEKRLDGLDAELRLTEARMENGMEAKMKTLQDQLFANMDKQMNATESRMVTRMNNELPPILEKYVNAKVSEIKH